MGNRWCRASRDSKMLSYDKLVEDKRAAIVRADAERDKKSSVLGLVENGTEFPELRFNLIADFGGHFGIRLGCDERRNKRRIWPIYTFVHGFVSFSFMSRSRCRSHSAIAIFK